MKKIETLFREISKIIEREKTQQEEKRKRGESFNIFNVLGLSTSEVRLHSAFLAELLNPDGDHGLGDKFLDSFIKQIIKKVEPSFVIDTKSCQVRSEYSIGAITEDYTEGGQLDLLIQDNTNRAIIIENKINAGDQENQLLRYQNYSKKNYKEYVLLYLTKHGTEASDESTNNEVDYRCISYEYDILPWLQNCIGIAALHPNIREIIAQYKLNLENILNIMSETNEKQELLRVMASCPREVEKIIVAQNDYRKYVFETFALPKLKEYAEKNDLICATDNLFAPKGERGVFFYRKQWRCMAICLWSDHSEREFYFGLSNYKTCDMSQFPKIQLECFNRRPMDNWPMAIDIWINTEIGILAAEH